MPGRILPREDWSAAALPKWPYLAVMIGALALVFAGQDDLRVCTRTVLSKAQQIDQALPTDPIAMEAAFERLSRAADLCQRGQPQQAEQLLLTVGVDRRS
jgi:hypothetical protein